MDEKAWKLLALMRSSRIKMSLVTNWLLLWALGPSLTLSVCLFIYIHVLLNMGTPGIWDLQPPWDTLGNHSLTVGLLCLLSVCLYALFCLSVFIILSVCIYCSVCLFIVLSIILSAGMSFCLINNSGEIQSQIRFLAMLKPNVHRPRVLCLAKPFFLPPLILSNFPHWLWWQGQMFTPSLNSLFFWVYISEALTGISETITSRFSLQPCLKK